MPRKLNDRQRNAQDGVLFTVTLSPSQLGAGLANESNIEQAAFLTSFLCELRKLCGSHFNVEMQLAHIAQELSAEDREALEMLSPNTD